MRAILLILAMATLLNGCAEEELSRVQKYSGMWKVSKVYTEYHDTTGLLKTLTKTDLGILDIRVGSYWGETLHEMRMDTVIMNNVIPFYNIRIGSSMDQYTPNEWGCFWQDDIDEARFYLEGFVGANSHVEVVNLEHSLSKMVWTWYEAGGEVPNTLTRKQVIELIK